MRKIFVILVVIATAGISMIIVGCHNQKTAKTTTSNIIAASATKITVAPDEAACPVLGTVMKKATMTPIRHNGKTCYIRCSDCQASFKANPEKYINHPAPLTREMSH